MKKFLPFFIVFFCSFTVYSQGFSNKGKDFWLVFPSHIPSGAAQAQMGLFFTSDQNSSGTITVNGFSTTFTVIANQVTGPIDIPFTNANIGTVNTVVNKGIHVQVNAGQPSVVLYAHIYAGFRSEASLILPVNTLGKKYISTNFWQASTNGSQSQFNIVATEANTVVQYQLRTNGVLSPTPVVVNLPNPGDQIQVQNVQDLSGSIIESISSGTGGCKKIAVFSGSSALSIGRLGCNGGSYDPLYQQCYPISSFGKNFGIIPFLNNANGYHIRIIASEDNTTVNVNGTNITLNTGEYFPATSANPVPYTTALTIISDKPITVSQYLMSAGCAGSTNIPGQSNPQGDPDMIILNPVEQNISDINIFSSNLQNIRTKYLNVYIKTIAAPSFRINNALPTGTFIPMPQNNGYSYLRENLTTYPITSFRLKADSGFNAISYGMGDAESYGYSAGTNVKDLYQVISIVNQYSIEEGTSVCVGSPYKFKIQLPYRPLKLTWTLSGITGLLPNNNTVVQNPDPSCTTLTGTDATTFVCHDSTTIINGKQVWFYSLPAYYTTTAQGSFPVNIDALTSNLDGCGTTQDIDFDLLASNPPIANFTFTQPGCIADQVQFTDATLTTKPNYHWYWDFDDPGSGAANFSNLQNPVHTFTTAATHNVRFSSITTPGCVSDTISKPVVVVPQPSATVSGTTSVCINNTSPDISFTATGGTAPYTFTYNINGGVAATITTTTGNTITLPVSTTIAGTFVYKLLSVKNAPSAVCITDLSALNLTATAIIKSNTSITLSSAAVTALQTPCLNTAITNITYSIQNATGVSVTNLPTGVIYNYAAGTGVLTISGTPTVILGSPTYTISVTGDCLPASITGSITVKPDGIINLTSAATSANQVVCKNASIIPIVYAAAIPSTGFTVTGLPAGVTGLQTGNIFTISGTPTVSNAAAYLYTVTATGGGCAEPSLAGIILVNALPTSNFIYTTPTCETRNINFNSSASLPNIGSITGWLWNFGDPASGISNTSNLPNPDHIFSAAGNYSATLKLTTNNGCENIPVPVNVTVSKKPLAGFIMPRVCLLDAYAQFFDTSTIVTGSITNWQWVFGDAAANAGNPNTSTAQNPTHVYPAIGNYNIDLIVTTNAGCKDSLVNQPLVISAGNPVSNYTFLNPINLCTNDSVALQNKSTIGSGNITKLVIYWDDINQPLLTDTIQVPVFNSIYKHKYPTQNTTQNYQVRMRAFSGNTQFCSSDKVVTITVHGTPNVSLAALPDVCLNNGPVQLTQGGEIVEGAPITHAGIYSGAGVSSTGLFTPTTEGSFNITYSYTTSFGCVDSKTLPIKVLAAPQAVIMVNNIRCEKSPVIFSQNSTAPVGTITQWIWNFEGIDELHTNGNPVTHTFNNAGPQNVYLTVITNDGCKSTKTLLPVAINIRPKPDFSFTANACLPNAKIDFTNLTPNISDFIYRWTFDNPPLNVQDSSNAVNPQHFYSTLGPHSVTLIAVSPLTGCLFFKNEILNTIHPAPLASFDFSQPAICVNKNVSVVFNGNAAGGTITNYNWNFGDNTLVTGPAPAPHTYNTANTFTVKLNIVNSFGCTDDTSRLFTVYPYPVVNAGADFFVLEGGSDTLRPIVTGNDLVYSWTASTTPSYLNSTSIKNPVTSPVKDVTYTLKVTARGGCFLTDSVFVKVLKFPQIPNTFTPNNDGIHDLWDIAYLYTYPNNRVQVFTRTGQLVFESKGYSKPWNGTMNGKSLPLDTYYYIIEPGNGRKPLTGYVTILK